MITQDLTERRADIARAALQAERLQRPPQRVDCGLIDRQRLIVGSFCLREHHLAPLKFDDERNCAPDQRALGLAHIVLATQVGDVQREQVLRASDPRATAIDPGQQC